MLRCQESDALVELRFGSHNDLRSRNYNGAPVDAESLQKVTGLDNR